MRRPLHPYYAMHWFRPNPPGLNAGSDEMQTAWAYHARHGPVPRLSTFNPYLGDFCHNPDELQGDQDMRFLVSVFAGYLWATIVVGFGLAFFMWLYEQAPPPPMVNKQMQRILFLQLHFHEFFWTWAVTGMVLSFVAALLTKPLVSVSVKIDGRAPNGWEEEYAKVR